MNNVSEGNYVPADNNTPGSIPFQGLAGDRDYRQQQDGKDDAVHHPSHYASGRFEVIDIIEDQLKMEGLRGFCLGNTLKYICRAGKKDPKKILEDLEKAEWYLHHYITVIKQQEGKRDDRG